MWYQTGRLPKAKKGLLLISTDPKIANFAKAAKILDGNVGNLEQNLANITNGNVEYLGKVGNHGKVSIATMASLDA